MFQKTQDFFALDLSTQNTICDLLSIGHDRSAEPQAETELCAEVVVGETVLLVISDTRHGNDAGAGKICNFPFMVVKGLTNLFITMCYIHTMKYIGGKAREHTFHHHVISKQTTTTTLAKPRMLGGFLAARILSRQLQQETKRPS